MSKKIWCLALFMLLILQTLSGVNGYNLFNIETSALDSYSSSVGLPKIGKIIPRSAQEIDSSIWSIGCEVLDRDYAKYDSYKPYLGPLGAKRARMQAGWAKTEKVKGVYNWTWLDNIVNDAISQGVTPWLEASYGNPIYSGGGGISLGSSFPSSAEAIAAWDAWVRALVLRYGDRVNQWEVWNEPANITQYCDFYLRTADIILAVQPNAKIVALANAGFSSSVINTFLQFLQDKGRLDAVHAITMHAYPSNPDSDISSYASMRNTIRKFSDTIELWQGESGAPSIPGSTGALSGFNGTEIKQAKWDLRRALGALGSDIDAYNFFTISDFYYPAGLNGKGLIAINKDKTVDSPKLAYYAVSNLLSIFDNTIEKIDGYSYSAQTSSVSIKLFGYQKKDTNKQLVTIWKSGATPVDEDTITNMNFVFNNGNFENPAYVNLIDGAVHSIPQANWSVSGSTYTFTDIPIFDSPILIADKSTFLSYTPTPLEALTAKIAEARAVYDYANLHIGTGPGEYDSLVVSALYSQIVIAEALILDPSATTEQLNAEAINLQIAVSNCIAYPTATPIPVPTPIATIIIDNTDSGTTFDEPWPLTTFAPGYYGANYASDGNNAGADPTKWAMWTPNITVAGTYNIYLRWPAGSNRPDNAPLEVKYNGGLDTTKTVNQQINNATWMLIGTYDLAVGADSYVKIIASDSGATIADAVKFDCISLSTTPTIEPTSTTTPSTVTPTPTLTPTPTPTAGPTTGAKIFDYEFKNYASVAAVVADGWTFANQSLVKLVPTTAPTVALQVGNMATGTDGYKTFAPIIIRGAQGTPCYLGANAKATLIVKQINMNGANVAQYISLQGADGASENHVVAISRLFSGGSYFCYGISGTGATLATAGINDYKFVISISDANGNYLAKPVVDVYCSPTTTNNYAIKVTAADVLSNVAQIDRLIVHSVTASNAKALLTACSLEVTADVVATPTPAPTLTPTPTIPAEYITITANPYDIAGTSLVRINVTGIINPATDNKVVIVKGVAARYTYYNGVYKFVAVADGNVTVDDVTVADAAPIQLIYADVDLNKTTDATDVNLLKGAVAGNRIAASYYELLASDVNGDGHITSSDLNVLKGFVAGNLVSMPVFNK